MSKEEMDRIKIDKEELIKKLSDYDISDTEKRFILRKIKNMSEKILEKAKYES